MKSNYLIDLMELLLIKFQQQIIKNYACRSCSAKEAPTKSRFDSQQNLRNRGVSPKLIHNITVLKKACCKNGRIRASGLPREVEFAYLAPPFFK